MGDTYEAALLTDYPWKLLGSKLIIDAGGGQGGLVLSLARMFVHGGWKVTSTYNLVPVSQSP